MHYENPPPPHEVNVSKTSEMGSFFKMTTAVAAILSALFAPVLFR
jgi:hypothetical protein